MFFMLICIMNIEHPFFCYTLCIKVYKSLSLNDEGDKLLLRVKEWWVFYSFFSESVVLYYTYI